MGSLGSIDPIENSQKFSRAFFNQLFAVKHREKNIQKRL